MHKRLATSSSAVKLVASALKTAEKPRQRGGAHAVRGCQLDHSHSGGGG